MSPGGSSPVWANPQHEGEDRRHGGRNAGEKGRRGDLGATLLSSSNKKGKTHTDLNDLSKALYKLQGQREGVAGGLGTPQTPYPLTRPLPLQHKGSKTESSSTRPRAWSLHLGFNCLSVHPPKETLVNTIPTPGAAIPALGLLEAEAGDLLS